MKTLIVYYSFSENNAKLADHLKTKLGCDVIKIETVRKRTSFSILLDLLFKRRPELKPIETRVQDYDYVIFMAPVWDGKIATPLKSFLLSEKDKLPLYSFVTVCGGGDHGQKAKVQKELEDLTGRSPENAIELWIHDLLSAEKRGSIKFTTGYRITEDDIDKFNVQITQIVNDAEMIQVK